MLRPVTWRHWLVIAVFAVAAATGAFVYAGDARVAGDGYAWGLWLGALAPLVYNLLITLFGKKWWENTLGLSLILSGFAAAQAYIPLWWAFAFHGGDLNNLFAGWVAITGQWELAALGIWRTWLLIQAVRDETMNGDSGTH